MPRDRVQRTSGWYRVVLFSMSQVYQSVISKERKGEYLGKTVQVVPHITDEIQVTADVRNGTSHADGRNRSYSLIYVGVNKAERAAREYQGGTRRKFCSHCLPLCRSMPLRCGVPCKL